MSAPLLFVEGVSVSFGAYRAVDGASFDVAAGSITGLIGPNGAGKTTLFNALAGEQRVDSGAIRFRGERIDGLPPERIFRMGVARTFQIPRPFAQMTVLENLMLAAPMQTGEAFWTALLSAGRVRAEDAAIRDKANEILAFTTLDEVADQAAGGLSGGQQKLLELARVLMGDPELILLDEPAAGVNPALMELLVDRILALNARGVTFLLIEHNMDLVMRHCDPVVALAGGKVIFDGPAADVAGDEQLLDAYLGDLAVV